MKRRSRKRGKERGRRRRRGERKKKKEREETWQGEKRQRIGGGTLRKDKERCRGEGSSEKRRKQEGAEKTCETVCLHSVSEMHHFFNTTFPLNECRLSFLSFYLPELCCDKCQCVGHTIAHPDTVFMLNIVAINATVWGIFGANAHRGKATNHGGLQPLLPDHQGHQPLLPHRTRQSQQPHKPRLQSSTTFIFNGQF